MTDEAKALEERANYEIERLREALAPFAREAGNHARPDIDDADRFCGDIVFGDLRRASAALGDSHD